MHAAPVRYVSVSELYATDEVELLLEEIRELEPTNCQAEEIQDFEIAGSGVGGGGRSPAGTERSWDSHAHYRRAPPPEPRPLAPVYCALSYLYTLYGAAALVIVLCSASACGCLWAVVGLRPWLMPLASRVKLLLLGAFTSFMIHGVILMMHITKLNALLPFNWDKLAMLATLWSFFTLGIGGGLTLHAVLGTKEYRYTPPHTSRLLYAAVGLGFSAALAALIVVMSLCHTWMVIVEAQRRPASRRSGSGPRSGSTRRSSSHSLRAAYRAVPQPSTSRDNPL